MCRLLTIIYIPLLYVRWHVSILQKRSLVLTAICFDNPDHVGRMWMDMILRLIMQKLKELDGYVGRIVDAIKEAGIYDNSIIIVTADHGGINKGHGGKTMQEMETPFIIAGKNVKKGGIFDESMMQFDCTSTVAFIFWLETTAGLDRPPL